MTSFAQQCGVHDGARQAALTRTAQCLDASGVADVFDRKWLKGG